MIKMGEQVTRSRTKLFGKQSGPDTEHTDTARKYGGAEVAGIPEDKVSEVADIDDEASKPEPEAGTKEVMFHSINNT